MVMDKQQETELMLTVLSSYLDHHNLVLQKLILAQKATIMCVQELQEQFQGDPETVNNTWSEIIQVFDDSGLTETELFSIEDIIGRIPKNIKLHYEALVNEDTQIAELKSKIDINAYKDAFTQIEE